MRILTALAALAALANCGQAETSPSEPVSLTGSAQRPAPAAPGANAPLAAAASAEGFDVTAVPVSDAAFGEFPFFGLMDGYEAMSKQQYSGDPVFPYQTDAAFDRYEIFDGSRVVPIEGRIRVTRAMGAGASYFQAQKNYEKLVRDLGGVTVFEGTNAKMKAKGLKFEDPRFRARYYDEKDRMGVYMIRRPDRQVWVEVYKPGESEDQSYWLTVIETTPLKVTSNLIPAAKLKTELDKDGRVAIPVLFDTDKANLKPESAAVIAEVVTLMKNNNGLKLAVEGHTDNQGSAARNRTLSDARAKAVAAAIAAGGVPTARLVPRGFGPDRPVAGNDDEAGRARNRRVELVKL